MHALTLEKTYRTCGGAELSSKDKVGYDALTLHCFRSKQNYESGSVNMAASCSRGVRSMLRSYESIGKKSCVFRPNTASQLPVRQICLSSCVWMKKGERIKDQKFTQEFINAQTEEYNIGKRHLANMMGEDLETFTQEDVNRCIKYLFPSGLFDKNARPFMKDPEQLFPKQKAVQWDSVGRPFHFLFYTGKQSYYSLMHEVFAKILEVEEYEDKAVLGSRWLQKREFEDVLGESISDFDHSQFIQVMERLLSMTYSSHVEEFIMRYRKAMVVQSKKQDYSTLKFDSQGVAFSTAEGKRKSANCIITLRDCGSGNIVINGSNYISYFTILQDREQLMFPFQFLGMLGRFDIEARVEGGGHSCQAGALRLAISRALVSFISDEEVEKLRQGLSTQPLLPCSAHENSGLLTVDPRIRERKKPGQEGARRKFAWNKR
ncbi:hypothetical protein DNTS_032245 [Danionella cerebrum]|uniref:Small ribosomal subunit protein uS9m n=1 Tax=Danionella cerebrum TaxID=2873325 RepID=A0A553NAM0_9TELE|nr:hypothetical protein DNTS_032245 [Danionella translucida]